jgi:hypothetical protein
MSGTQDQDVPCTTHCEAMTTNHHHAQANAKKIDTKKRRATEVRSFLDRSFPSRVGHRLATSASLRRRAVKGFSFRFGTKLDRKTCTSYVQQNKSRKRSWSIRRETLNLSKYMRKVKIEHRCRRTNNCRYRSKCNQKLLQQEVLH